MKIDEKNKMGTQEKKMQAKNGEPEGEELSESDDRSLMMSGANEFSSPSEPFGTFQL